MKRLLSFSYPRRFLGRPGWTACVLLVGATVACSPRPRPSAEVVVAVPKTPAPASSLREAPDGGAQASPPACESIWDDRSKEERDDVWGSNAPRCVDDIDYAGYDRWLEDAYAQRAAGISSSTAFVRIREELEQHAHHRAVLGVVGQLQAPLTRGRILVTGDSRSRHMRNAVVVDPKTATVQGWFRAPADGEGICPPCGPFDKLNVVVSLSGAPVALVMPDSAYVGGVVVVDYETMRTVSTIPYASKTTLAIDPERRRIGYVVRASCPGDLACTDSSPTCSLGLIVSDDLRSFRELPRHAFDKVFCQSGDSVRWQKRQLFLDVEEGSAVAFDPDGTPHVSKTPSRAASASARDRNDSRPIRDPKMLALLARTGCHVGSYVFPSDACAGAEPPETAPPDRDGEIRDESKPSLR